jgi:hypothetical protein
MRKMALLLTASAGLSFLLLLAVAFSSRRSMPRLSRLSKKTGLGQKKPVVPAPKPTRSRAKAR